MKVIRAEHRNFGELLENVGGSATKPSGDFLFVINNKPLVSFTTWMTGLE